MDRPIDVVRKMDKEIIEAVPRELLAAAFVSRAVGEMPLIRLMDPDDSHRLLNRILISTWNVAHQDGQITEPVPEKYRHMALQADLEPAKS